MTTLLKEFNKQQLLAFHHHKAKNDIAYFAKFYFSHYIKKNNSRFHHYLYSELKRIVESEKGERLACASPRGNAKSSIISLIFVLWCIVYEKKKFIILMSDSSSQANEFLENIKTELEGNEDLKLYYGDLTSDELWRADEIITKNKIKVLALGAGKKIRGRRYKEFRPDLIIGDDIENDENVSSPEQRQKIYSWWMKAVSKAGNDNTDIILIGTILHYDSLLAKLLNNPLYISKKWRAIEQFSSSEKWQTWENMYFNLTPKEREEKPNKADKFFLDNKEEMLQGTKVLWGENMNYYDLMLLRLSEGSASFDSEFQNNPINPDDCLFQEEWFKFHNFDYENYTSLVGAVDPSLGKNTKSDFSAIIILGQHKDGFLDVLVADIKRRHPDQIINDILTQTSTIQSYCKNAAFQSFGVETVAFQEYFKDSLISESNKKHVYLPVESIENQGTKKQLRIQTLQPLIKNGTIRFDKSQTLLIEQLKYFPLADHDDAPDALEMAVRVAKQPQIYFKSL